MRGDLTGRVRLRPLRVPQLFGTSETKLVLQVEAEHVDAQSSNPHNRLWRDARVEDFPIDIRLEINKEKT